MNVKFLIIFAALFAFVILPSVKAQMKFCPLDLNVIQYRPIDSEAPDFPISGTAAIVTNITTKKLTRAILLEGMPRFARLREGKYNVTVTKSGYKKTVKQITIDCSGLDNDGSAQELIFLQKGSAKETYRMPNQVIGTDSKAVNSPQETGYTGSTSAETNYTDRGVINNAANELVAPAYPAAAKTSKASGSVNVKVIIDERGNVVSAAAISGHPLLRSASEKAARNSKFEPTLLSGQPVKITGIIVYNFVS
jgi:TonB family protein